MSLVAHTATLPLVAYSIGSLSAAAVSFHVFSNSLSYIAVLVCVKPAKRFNMCVKSQAQSQELNFRHPSISAHSTGSYCQITLLMSFGRSCTKAADHLPEGSGGIFTHV